MKYYTLANGMRVSAVALGCMRMNNITQAQADTVIETALEQGINFFDHADIYGRGECEIMFGDYLKRNPSLRDKIYIQSKCAIKPGEFDFSRDYIIKSVDGILDRLNTDYLDSLLLHRPDALMEPQEVAEAFDYLEESGKVRNFGVSNHNTMQIELLKTAVKQPISINQMQFSIAHCPMITAPLNVNMKNDESFMHSDPVIEYSRINGILLQAWSPFRGDYNKSTFLGDYERYGELNNKLDEIAQRYSVTSQAIASAWILRHPAGIQLISGSMNPDRIVEVCNGAEVSLTRKEWYEIYLSAGYNLP